MSKDFVIRTLIIDDADVFDSVAAELLNASALPRIVFDKASSGAEAMLQFTTDPHQLVFLNLELVEDNALALLKSIKTMSWFTDVVAMCRTENIQLILGAMRNHASDVLIPPFSAQDLEQTLSRFVKRQEMYANIQGGSQSIADSVENRLKAISHDTKNYISSAGQSLEILENEILKRKRAHYGEIDWEPLLFYAKNVKDILNFCLENLAGQLDQGLRQKIQNDPLEFNEFDIIAMLREVCEDFLPICSHKQIPLALETSKESVSYYGRQGDIYHLLTNLIQNSIKYSDQGKRIQVCMDGPIHIDENVGYIELNVVDSGRGIAPDILPHIFDKGFAGGSTGNNTGFGLYFVKKVVEEHNGEVFVTSEPGQGTTIQIKLPVLL